jgi:O-6-methylguanine DNA methyltransferase
VGTGPVGKPATAAARKLIEQARLEIHEYLRGQRAFFRVPVDLTTVPDFQRSVLQAAGHIPFGEARAYAWIAARVGHPRAVRAVGTALGRNPVPLILPCHRVWRSDGGLGGYIFGADVKDRLAALERTTPVLEGCTSTRIVCRVGCIHGRHMRRDNRVVFASVEDARSVGYRPCKVCRPAA